LWCLDIDQLRSRKGVLRHSTPLVRQGRRIGIFVNLAGKLGGGRGKKTGDKVAVAVGKYMAPQGHVSSFTLIYFRSTYVYVAISVERFRKYVVFCVHLFFCADIYFQAYAGEEK
jgi:hypothetical protein